MYETPYFKEYIQVLSSFHDKKNLLEQLFSHEQAESFHRRVHDYLPLVISKEDALQWGKNMPKIEHINRHITALFGQILYAHYNIPLDERMMYGTDFWIHPDAQSCISEYYFLLILIILLILFRYIPTNLLTKPIEGIDGNGKFHQTGKRPPIGLFYLIYPPRTLIKFGC